MSQEELPKIILNWLPPATIELPSPSMSILKEFLLDNNIETNIVYWNIEFYPLFRRYYNVDIISDLAQLLPFISMLNDIKGCKDNQDKILNSIQALTMRYRFRYQNDYYSIFADLRNKIINTIETSLNNLDLSEVKLFGVHNNLYQWISAITLSRIIKEKYPDIKTVIGGLGIKETGMKLLEYCQYFDFSIWGEGEYPLLELYNNIDNYDAWQDIPGLIYRDKDNKIKFCDKKRKFIDINNYTPSFQEYFDTSMVKNTIESSIDDTIWIPINRIRGCLWNKCKFCVLNRGYKYREADPGITIKQMKYYIEKYEQYRFRFIDNEIVGKDIDRFENLLSLLMELSKEKGHAMEIFGEIIPYKMNASLIKRMAAAGIKNVQIGVEALTDKLLEKINKKIRFADTLLFIKFALKYGVNILGANIIRGIPDETLSDVSESIKNLHFLRFFMGDQNNKMKLKPIQLAVYKGSPFYNEMTGDELSKWNYDDFYQLVPKTLILDDPFVLFGLVNQLFPNYSEWMKFEAIYKEYEKANCYYSIVEEKGVVFFAEYYDNRVVNYIVFDEPIYWEVLRFANDTVRGFDELYSHLSTKYNDISREEAIDILDTLKNEYLLYSSEDLSQIVTVIDTSSY
jgi:radical SAM superfamily enzyme YgiQ (UPF0313 family)